MSYLFASGLAPLDYDTRSLAEANVHRYHAIRIEPCEREDHRRKLWGLRSTYLHHATKLAHDSKLLALELWYHFVGVSYRNAGIRLLSSWRPVSWFRYTSTTYPFSSTLEEVHCLQYLVTFHLDYSLWVEGKIFKDGFRLHEVGKIMGVSRLALAAEEQRALIRLSELAREEHGNGYQARSASRWRAMHGESGEAAEVDEPLPD
jgi:hypothetical protein